MNSLERSIVDAARVAQSKYQQMTGWWLSHGPESFIEHEVAIKIAQTGFSVFPEASPKKIMKEQDKRPRGRPAKNLGKRFDIVVWLKSSNEVRAILEIKRAWSTADLRGDRKKVATALNQGLARAGYLLAYTEAKGRRHSDSVSASEKAKSRADTLSNRLSHWADTLDIELIGRHLDPRGDGEWGWAIGLFRVTTP